MKRLLLAIAIVSIAHVVVASDDFDAYMAFCKEEFKFEFCGVDDSVKAFRVPISQKYVEAQFSSQYSGNALRKTLYNHLVEFESATTNRQDYLSALSNLVADVEFVFKTESKSNDTQRLFNDIKGLQKHHSIVKIGTSKPRYIKDKAFWELYKDLRID